ncbi:MAG: hypothetical protein QQN55_03690 [Nitrosopumilus sp.]
MKNTEQQITAEYLDSINYFKLKNTLTDLGVGEAFKGGTKKSDIIKSAMKMYAQLKKAKANDEKVEVIEPYTYTTDEDGNMISIMEIDAELNDKEETIETKIEEADKQAPKRSREVIEKHMAKVLKLTNIGLETHKKHWSNKLTELTEELEDLDN